MKPYRSADDLLTYFNVQPKKALVVGSKIYGSEKDRRILYPNSVGLDIESGLGVDVVHDLEHPISDIGKFDHIDCHSVFEHVKRPWKMAENIEMLMEPNATILLSVPFSWRLHNYPGDYWRMTLSSFPILFPTVDWKERVYLLENGPNKSVPGLNKYGCKYIQRSQAIALGVKCSTS